MELMWVVLDRKTGQVDAIFSNRLSALDWVGDAAPDYQVLALPINMALIRGGAHRLAGLLLAAQEG